MGLAAAISVLYPLASPIDGSPVLSGDTPPQHERDAQRWIDAVRDSVETGRATSHLGLDPAALRMVAIAFRAATYALRLASPVAVELARTGL
jgi:hypothetical protein